MQILDRRTFLALTGAAATLPLAARAAPTAAQVFTADDWGALVDSTVILGQSAAVLIDAQLTMPNATRLAEMIAATGRRLESVFITHAHPDHYLGLEAIVAAFPDARLLTPAPVLPLIEASAEATLDFLRGTAPEGTFASRIILPEAFDSDHILLEGERIEILPPMHGDTDLVSAVHLPALDTLIVSDFAYAETHAWVAENLTDARLDLWRASIAQLQSLGAGTVIPGHRKPESASDASVFAKTLAYLDQWQAALASTTDAESLRAAMMAGNDTLGLGFALDRAIAAAYPTAG